MSAPEPKRSRTEYQREYKRKLRASRSACGICIQCGVLPRVNATYCDECRSYVNAYHRTVRVARAVAL